MSYIENSRPLRQREPRVRDKAYLGWVARLPCVACAAQGRGFRDGVHVAHIRASWADQAGWRDVGRSEKPSDVRTAPLCPAHHMDGPEAQHRMSERQFWAQLGIWPPAFCGALRRAYEDGEDGRDVIRLAINGAYVEWAR